MFPLSSITVDVPLAGYIYPVAFLHSPVTPVSTSFSAISRASIEKVKDSSSSTYVPPPVYVLVPMAESISSITSCAVNESELYSSSYIPTKDPPEVILLAPVSFNPISPI